MSWVMVAMAATQATVKIVGALQGRKARIEEQKQANQELAKRKVDLEGTDVSNPYANMENSYEDLTVNTKQAEFEANQNTQNQANIMDNMKGAAGSSGVAGLAQAMANQGSQQSARASASIGQQESANQKLAAGEQSKNQGKERYGKMLEQDRTMDKAETLMGLSQQRKIGADDARQRAKEQMIGGAKDAGNSASMAVSAMQMKGSPVKQIKGGVSGYKMKGPLFFNKAKNK